MSVREQHIIGSSYAAKNRRSRNYAARCSVGWKHTAHRPFIGEGRTMLSGCHGFE
jgi:hypothetical protein